MRRCFLCRADMLQASGRGLVFPDGSRQAYERACGSCGVLLRAAADPDACRADLRARLCEPEFVAGPDADYGLDLYTLRTAATALGRGVRALDATGQAALAHPHDRRAGRGLAFDLSAADSTPVSLGLLCRAGEVEAVLAGLCAHARWCGDVAILADGEAAPARAVPVVGFPAGAVRLAGRPLAGDFSAQRNALHDLARHRWMLQLDADEHLCPDAAALLPALAALAEAGEAVSVGLARRNLVDGVLSDVYPDVQYRLNRTHLRYAGRVHERPRTGGWRHGFISLHGAIEHRLSARHVRARSLRYEALDPGRGRPEEAEALLRPYRD